MDDVPTNRTLSWQQLLLTAVAIFVSSQTAISLGHLEVGDALIINAGAALLGFATARWTRGKVGLPSDLREPVTAGAPTAMAKVVLLLPAVLTMWTLVAASMQAPFRSYGWIGVAMSVLLGGIIERLLADRA